MKLSERMFGLIDMCGGDENMIRGWADEVAQLEAETANAVAQMDEVIDKNIKLEAELAAHKENEGDEALSELLSPLVDVELERDKLKEENEALREDIKAIEKNTDAYADENEALKASIRRLMELEPILTGEQDA